MRHRRFGGMVVLFACILAGSPLGFAGQETIRVQPDDDQSEFIQLAQASGSVDMPSSGMGAGGARPPSRINPPHQIQPPMNGGGFGMGGGAGHGWPASLPFWRKLQDSNWNVSEGRVAPCWGAMLLPENF